MCSIEIGGQTKRFSQREPTTSYPFAFPGAGWHRVRMSRPGAQRRVNNNRPNIGEDRTSYCGFIPWVRARSRDVLCCFSSVCIPKPEIRHSKQRACAVFEPEGSPNEMERECSDFVCLLWFLLFGNSRTPRLGFFVFSFFVSGSFSCAMDGSTDNGNVSPASVGNSSVAVVNERIASWRRAVAGSFSFLRSKTGNSSSGDTVRKRECAVLVPE